MRWIRLRRCVADGLLMAVAGCGDGGGGSAIPPFEGDAAVEASAGVAASLGSVLAVILAGPPEMPDREDVPEIVIIRRGGMIPCIRGGAIDATCRESSGRTTVTSRLANCSFADERTGLVVRGTGELSAIIEEHGVCATGVVPTHVPITVRYRRFDADFLSDSEVVQHFSAPDLTETIVPLAGGCSGNDGTVTLQGQVSVARADGVDVSLNIDRMVLEIGSSGSPCVQHGTLSGRFAVEDRSAGRNFEIDTDGVGFSFSEDMEPPEFTLDGTANVDCLGPTTLVTAQPIAGVAGCPLGGELLVDLYDQSRGAVGFSGGGVELDYDGDGTVDRTAADCRDAFLAQCAKPLKTQ